MAPTAALWPGQTDEKELGLTYFQLSVAENTGGNAAGETIYVDNFQVPQVVPEPGTVALLGLSGMGALVLRRRAAR